MSVSVLIPAFRPDFLKQAIASVLVQTHTDYELLISDDSGDEYVRKIVCCFNDERIKLVRTAGRQGGQQNVNSLWEKSSRRYVKYLFDDDFLYPFALQQSLAALKSVQGSSFCFAQRHFVDGEGSIIGTPACIPDGKVVLLAHRDTVGTLLNHVRNPIGELSNVMIDREAGIKLSDHNQYFGYQIEVLGDVCFYLNASRKGVVVGIGNFNSAFRMHANQNSSPKFNPRFSAGVFEWELFLRGEIETGGFDRTRVPAAISHLESLYRKWKPEFPELEVFRCGLPSLLDAVQSGAVIFLTEEFRKNWDYGQAKISDRIAERDATRK